MVGTETIYTNFRLVLPDGECLGTLVSRNGKISDIQPGRSVHGRDGEGAYLSPGLIDLHTDNIGQCLEPRYGASWPITSALLIHDRALASGGITTVCDSINVGDVNPFAARAVPPESVVRSICDSQAARRFVVDHRIHLRFEMSCPDAISMAGRHLDNKSLGVVTIMDKTHGERPEDVERFLEYYIKTHRMSRPEAEQLTRSIQSRYQQYGELNRRALTKLCRDRAVPFGTHDNSTSEQIRRAAEEGVTVAEFPTTIAAARTARSLGLHLLFGAPNVVIGRSHKGNLSAIEMAKLGLLDVLVSDYVPGSLIESLFIIVRMLELPVYEVFKLATESPAKLLGLSDRGSLVAGNRADIIGIRMVDQYPTLLFRDVAGPLDAMAR
jgi:alpha-D-ribose 1-methylphosphonate 5-triphosphate diphosphatase